MQSGTRMLMMVRRGRICKDTDAVIGCRAKFVYGSAIGLLSWFRFWVLSGLSVYCINRG